MLLLETVNLVMDTEYHSVKRDEANELDITELAICQLEPGQAVYEFERTGLEDLPMLQLPPGRYKIGVWTKSGMGQIFCSMMPVPDGVHFEYVDLLSLAARLHPAGTVLSRNLDALHQELFGQLNTVDSWHTALFDAQATIQIAGQTYLARTLLPGKMVPLPDSTHRVGWQTGDIDDLPVQASNQERGSTLHAAL